MKNDRQNNQAKFFFFFSLLIQTFALFRSWSKGENQKK